MKVEYHPSTTLDANEAIQHYDQQQPSLGMAFRSEVYAAIERIKANPEMYAEVSGVRRALVRRFPYSVVYKLIGNQTIRVLLIRHHRRHPQYGSQRQ